jgi:hypothetical protein
VTLDLSHITYIATANTVDPLPGPIRDRFRIITFPKPNSHDLDALLPAVIADLSNAGSIGGGSLRSTLPNVPLWPSTGAADRFAGCVA